MDTALSLTETYIILIVWTIRQCTHLKTEKKMADDYTKDKARQMAKILNAFADGKTIERYNVKTERWTDMTEGDSFYFMSAFKYRVKAKPEYVPFASSLEFQEAARKHGFWMEEISSGKTYLPVNVDNDYVGVVQKDGSEFIWTYGDMRNKFIWTDDGSPIGKLV